MTRAPLITPDEVICRALARKPRSDELLAVSELAMETATVIADGIQRGIPAGYLPDGTVWREAAITLRSIAPLYANPPGRIDDLADLGAALHVIGRIPTTVATPTAAGITDAVNRIRKALTDPSSRSPRIP